MLKVAQVDPAGGRILIDGIDITTIGLHDLRSRIVGIQSGKLKLARLSHSNGRPSFHRMPLFFLALYAKTLILSVRSHGVSPISTARIHNYVL
jgi:hypothetical protein